MILRHWSEKDISELHDKINGDNHKDVFRKPNGLWLSDEHSNQSWHNFCRENNYHLETRFKHFKDYEIDLERIIWLKNEKDLYDFTCEYGTTTEMLACSHYIDLVHDIEPDYSRKRRAIDWEKVARKHNGILITPYVWKCRLALDWYYTWDCASACAWDVSCLTAV